MPCSGFHSLPQACEPWPQIARRAHHAQLVGLQRLVQCEATLHHLDCHTVAQRRTALSQRTPRLVRTACAQHRCSPSISCAARIASVADVDCSMPFSRHEGTSKRPKRNQATAKLGPSSTCASPIGAAVPEAPGGRVSRSASSKPARCALLELSTLGP
eukprot:69440-Prymnesium_polylepis.1